MEKLLIVEDEKLIRQGIKTIIERSGVSIQTILECSNAPEALKILKSEKIDVVFTDIRMPKMDGIGFVEAIQKLETKPLIVAVSGYDDFNYAVKLLRQGVREYLLKPVDREQVKTILEKLDKEIEVKKNLEEIERGIGKQQIKNFILNQYLTQEESNFIVKRYNDSCLGGEYLVVCVPTNQIKKSELEEVIVLEEVEGQTLYIISSKSDLNKLKEKGRCIGISRYHRRVEGLIKAYQEALFARRQAFYLNEQYVIFNQTLVDAQQKNREDKQWGGLQILQMIQMIGMPNRMGEVLESLKVMKGAVIKGELSFSNFEKNICLFINELIKAYQNVLEEKSADVRVLIDLLKYESVEMYMEVLINWVISINDDITGEFEDYKNKQKINEAILYMKAYYHTNLNMAVVSNYVSMNYSLFSHAFKAYTGKNFVSYLKELRMEEAENLLNTTEYKINEISHKVGYENEKHFMKLFKGTYGVSPTEYRKNMLFKRNSR